MKKIFFLLLILFPSLAWAWTEDFRAALKNGGALVMSEKGKILFSHRADELFIPASTIKVATSAWVLKVLGREFRHPTDFYLGSGNVLFVKGYGDPALVSEEIERIAKKLKAKGLKSVSQIICDASYFSENVNVDGASASTNPYDAVNGALIANYNTVYISKSGGRVQSAESQTPLTPIVIEFAKHLGPGKQRVNLGKDPRRGAIYFGELLATFLEKQNVRVTGGVSVGKVPEKAPKFYRHFSSRTVAENLRGLLEYSTNFIANQYFLVLGAMDAGAPASPEKSIRALKNFLTNEVGWQGFSVGDGAGLSRQTNVSPQHMMTLLKYFKKDQDLLPLKEGLLAKTGTLTGVNTLVGYFPSKVHGQVLFVILVNSPVPYDYKFRLGKILRNNL